MSVSIALHLVAAVIWVGGLFFAYMALRPAAAKVLDPPLRLQLWVGCLQLFFLWVWICILVLLATGYWMVFSVFDGFAHVGNHVHIMHAGGILMILLYLHVFFAPYRRLRHAVITRDYDNGTMQLARIRLIVGFNLILGLIIVVIASAGRYL